MHVLQWSGRTTGHLDYKNWTEPCFRESHWIQWRCPFKDPYHGDSLHHPDSDQVSCLTNCIVDARITLSQYPNHVSFFNVCSVCNSLCSKWQQKQIKCHEFFCYQCKLFQWMIALMELFVSYIAICQFWNHVQANTSNRSADITCQTWEAGTWLTIGKMWDDVWWTDY